VKILTALFLGSKMQIDKFTKVWKECKFKDMHFETFGKAYPNLSKQKTA
jgi:hypothetical protein